PRISVIESPNIPTVGVGEGSTALFRQVLQDLGIDEAEFLRCTGATIKFGIRHQDWQGKGTGYFGPIDDPNLLVPAPMGIDGPWLHTARIASGKPVQDIHLFTHLMRGRKAPVAQKPDGSFLALSPFHHAFHFDQARLGRYLAEKATGIEHIKAEVEDIIRDPVSGNITSLTLAGSGDLPVDFVIDCTGFRRALISKLGSQWHSYADMLPLDQALPFWLEHRPDQDLPPYTLAKAMSAGWMWSIPTQDRMGCGYVFSEAHQTPENALAEIETCLGQKIEPRGLIAIKPGRLKEAWIGNCVAIGLAQSFLEPLEATSIHGTLVQLLLLTQTRPKELTSGRFASARQRYNDTVAGQVDDYAQFINVHYAGGRNDSTFWRDMAERRITEIVRERLAVWQREPVKRRHFPRFPAKLPHVEEQLHLPVLSGLGLLPSGPSKSEMAADPEARSHARQTLLKLTTEFKTAARKAIGHRGYLSSLA
ncbi:MAG: tryptophan 7-halogenase, partial [Geminicoccaceae bacterium]